jgi:hypothetical protein
MRKIDIPFQISDGLGRLAVFFHSPRQNNSSYFRLDIPKSVLYMFFRVMGGRKTAVTL